MEAHLTGPTDATGGVLPLSEAEIAEIRAAAKREQLDDGHICLTPRLCLALLDRLEALEAALECALPILEAEQQRLYREGVCQVHAEMNGVRSAVQRARAALGRPGAC